MSSSSVQNSSLKVSVFVFSLIIFVNSQVDLRNETALWRNCELDVNFHCVEIWNCPQVIASLTNITVISPELSNSLRKLQCGWENGNPKICCINVKEEPAQVHSELDKDVIVTNHSAINLFPSKDCGSIGHVSDKILGGRDTRIDEFPWMALILILRGDSRSYQCGGTLINNRYVLTAAHCVLGQNVKQVRLGEWDLTNEIDCIEEGLIRECNDPPIDVDVDTIIVHPDYRVANSLNDIALIRLAKEVNYTQWVSPICMPFSSTLRENTYEKELLTISGWGRTEIRQKSPRKQKLKLPVEEFSLCSKLYKESNVTLTKNQMCAGGEIGKDSCTGDSGGPLMSLVAEDGDTKWYLVGITSYGRVKCGITGWPGVYTRVGSYIDWILNQVVR